jgi:hypothetical protein
MFEVVTITNTLFFRKLAYGFLKKDFIVLCYRISTFKT